MTPDRDVWHLAATRPAPTISGMSASTLPPDTRSRRSTARHLVRHYLEMVVAMLVGMAVLGSVHQLLWPALTARADVAVMVMATDMAIGMGAWMKFRGHSWRGIAEMSAAMYAPFAVLLVPFWLGTVGEGDLMMWGHVLMFPAMALVMYLRPAEYAH